MNIQKNKNQQKSLLLLLVIIMTNSVLAQTTQKKNYDEFITEPVYFIQKDSLTGTNRIQQLAPYDTIPDSKLDALYRSVKNNLPNDSVLLTDLIHYYRPLMDAFSSEDPHFRMLIPPFIKKDEKINFELSDLHVLPFDLLLIGDTAIVEHSYEKQFSPGDRIISVNNIPFKNFINYSYKDRYSPAYLLQAYYHFTYTPEYSVLIERDGEKKLITSNSTTLQEVIAPAKDKQIIFSQYHCGYFSINSFDNNKQLVKDLTSFIDKMKTAGCDNLIIDLRKNRGGNGNNFDKLLSIFTDLPNIPYSSGEKIKVSDVTQQSYKYLKKETKGELVDVPEKYIVHSVSLHPKMFKRGINFYVLISRQTGSMAASFANILQYNKLAMLVGEPLMRNALAYGEVTILPWEQYPKIWLSMSTKCIGEYTNAINGILQPDIPIPYNAERYMQGGDPTLEQLLNVVKRK